MLKVSLVATLQKSRKRDFLVFVILAKAEAAVKVNNVNSYENIQDNLFGFGN